MAIIRRVSINESFDVSDITLCYFCTKMIKEQSNNTIGDLRQWAAIGVWIISESENIPFIQLCLVQCHTAQLSSTANAIKWEYLIAVPYLHLNVFIYHPIKVLKTMKIRALIPGKTQMSSLESSELKDSRLCSYFVKAQCLSFNYAAFPMGGSDISNRNLI